MRIAFVGDSLTAGVPGSSYLAILRAQLPGYELLNLGRGNDTIVSLYRRLARLRFGAPCDMAFLWVGVNDVVAASPWTFKFVNALLRKPPARNLDEFEAYYRATLELLCRHARRVITVSPLLKGEDLHSPLNHALGILAETIAGLTSCYAQATYLDLRAIFAQKLGQQHVTSYLPQSMLRVALDALTLRSDERVDRKAAERGLYFTLDGIHLNSAGARIVAEAFLRCIAS